MGKLFGGSSRRLGARGVAKLEGKKVLSFVESVIFIQNCHFFGAEEVDIRKICSFAEHRRNLGGGGESRAEML